MLENGTIIYNIRKTQHRTALARSTAAAAVHSLEAQRSNFDEEERSLTPASASIEDQTNCKNETLTYTIRG